MKDKKTFALSNKAKGQLGEKMAVRFLKGLGMRIVTMNYATEIGEIDIIAIDKNTLVFVEVKYRTSDYFNRPADAVNLRKRRTIYRVASQFLHRHRLIFATTRFDIIEIVADKNKINHIPNAFTGYNSY